MVQVVVGMWPDYSFDNDDGDWGLRKVSWEDGTFDGGGDDGVGSEVYSPWGEDILTISTVHELIEMTLKMTMGNFVLWVDSGLGPFICGL